MACDISMNDAPIVAHPSYMPRNAINHMSPFFFKTHQQAHSNPYGHSHGQHRHHHNHHRHSQQQQQQQQQQPYTPPTPHPHSNNKDYLDTPSTTSSSSPSPVDLQTPVPRRLSVHAVDLSTAQSYNTPPATPPLTLLEKQRVQAAAAAATAAAANATVKAINDPLAWCTARARIPTPDGSEYFLHIYENKMDKKEHLAFVFGDAIRSQSLDKVQPNETEADRMKRGAYTGRLQNTVSLDDQQQAQWETGSTTQQQQQHDQDPIAVAATTSATVARTTTATASSSVTTVVSVDGDEDTIMETTSSLVSSGPDKVPLVRIHSECFTGEIGHSARCDCGEQLDEAIRLMKADGAGVVVYLRQEGRGIGLGEKLKAYNLQDLGYDTVMANLLLNHGADERTYEVAQGILQDLGLEKIRLLTNNPDKIEQIEKESSIAVVERVPMMPKSWEAIQLGVEADFEVKEGAVENKIVKGKELDKYLKVKVERMRHLIPIPTSL
ncbi:GTP cyclohydrolase II [Dissophora ornata]|nr:GTP cyclohydrolase II [Dissophora ornata]